MVDSPEATGGLDSRRVSNGIVAGLDGSTEVTYWKGTGGGEGQEWWDVRVNAVVVHQLYLPLPIISRGDIPTNTTPRRTYLQLQWQC